MPREQRAAAGPARVAADMDDVRGSWRAAGFGAGGETFIAAASVLRFQRVMSQAIEGELRPLKINLTDYLLLMTLELNDHGTRLISQLARALVIHATTATMATDRLEARGLLARTPHPTDRRATEVRITAEGRELVHTATGALAGAEFGLAGSSRQDRDELIDVLARLRRSAGDDLPPISG